MAAPADLPEFRGNVAAVFTEHYWDGELTRLRGREALIERKASELQSKGNLSLEERNAAGEKLRSEEFTPRESEILHKSVSNLEYHYLGSAKIMAQIGKAFAEALSNLYHR